MPQHSLLHLLPRVFLREVPEMLQSSLLISGLGVCVGTRGAWDRDIICGKETFWDNFEHQSVVPYKVCRAQTG